MSDEFVKNSTEHRPFRAVRMRLNIAKLCSPPIHRRVGRDDFRILAETMNSAYKEMRCTEMVDYNQRRPYFWIDTPGNNMQLLFVTDRDEVVIWPACSDERATLTELFPELPQALLATDESGSQFIFAGETSYWLSDANMLAPRQITGLEVMPWRGASWSPDARYVALSQINNDDEATTYLIDVERAEVVQAISWQSPGGKGGTYLSFTQQMVAQG